MSKLNQIMQGFKNPDPKVRKRALQALVEVDHPKVEEGLQHIASNDPDEEVRAIAKDYLRKYKSKFAVVSNAWKCEYCGAENELSQTACSSCYADRAESVPNLDQAIASQPAPLIFGKPLPDAAWSTPFFWDAANENFVLGSRPNISRKHSWQAVALSIFFILVFIGGTLVVAGLTVPAWQDASQVAEHGAVTDGSIVNKRISSSDDSTSYYVTFSYVVNGQRYNRERSVKHAYYTRTANGQNVSVIYATINPGNAYPSGQERDAGGALRAMVFFIGIGVLLILASLVGLYSAVASLDKIRLLEEKGELIVGQIIKSTGTEDSEGAYSLDIRYEFTTPDTDKILRKRKHGVRSDLKGKPVPPPGTPVKIIYHNQRNFWLL